MRTRSGVIAAAVIGLLVSCSDAALAQSAAELFDTNTIQEIRLSVNSRDLRTLRETFQTNTYYPADLTWKNIRVRNVGIRSRGFGSRNPTKLGLRVDMARYTTGQKLVGLSTIILDNLWQDDSMIREKLAFTFFERLGQPAPRESYCRLFINNEYQGLYTITEEIDGAFAQRVTGETDGTVFEFHADNARPFRAEDLGAIENYKPFFEPRTHELDADTTLYTPIQQLFREANGPDDAVWRARVEQYLDLNSFMVHVGIEQFMAENDGVLGVFGMNNFYLYRFQGSQRHRLFVWDQDNAFNFTNSPIATTDANVIFRRAMTHADLREVYLKTLEDCANLAKTDDWLAIEIDRLIGIIFEAARADTRKQFDNNRFDEAVNFLRVFAALRPNQVLADVDRIRRTGS
jgi:spore coat protein CotH